VHRVQEGRGEDHGGCHMGSPHRCHLLLPFGSSPSIEEGRESERRQRSDDDISSTVGWGSATEFIRDGYTGGNSG